MTTKKLVCDGCGVPLSGADGRVGDCPYCARALLAEPTVEARATPGQKTEPVFANPRTPTTCPVDTAPPVNSFAELDPPANREPEHQPTEPMLALSCSSVWHLPVLVGVSIYAAVATAFAVWGWLRPH